jgi:hypothetical protein
MYDAGLRSRELLTPDARFLFGDVDATVAQLPLPRSQEGIVLSLTPNYDGTVTGQFCFDPQLLGTATIGRWADHFLMLLGDAVTHPHRTLSELALLTPREVHM